MSGAFDPYREWLGIDPEEHPIDLYRLLGLTRFESNAEVIINAADQRMSHVRRFQTGPRGKHTQPLLNELALARRTLLDEERRQAYDAELREQQAAELDVAAQLPPPAGSGGIEAETIARQLPPPVPEGPVDRESPPPFRPVVTSPLSPTPPTVVQPRTNVHRPRRSPLAAVSLVLFGVLGVAGAVWGIGQLWKGALKPDGSKTRPGSGEEDQPKLLVRQPVQRIVEVAQESNGEVNLSPTIAGLYGSNIRREMVGDEDILSNWKSADDWATWHFRIVKAGAFRVRIVYRLPSGKAGGSYALLLDNRQIKVASTRNRSGDIVDEHHLILRRPGAHVFSIRPTAEPRGVLMDLKSVRLIPTRSG